MFDELAYNPRLRAIAGLFEDCKTEAREAELRSELLTCLSDHGYPVEQEGFDELFDRLVDAWLDQPLAGPDKLVEGINLLTDEFF